MKPEIARTDKKRGTTLLVETAHLCPPTSFVTAFVQAGGDINAKSEEGYAPLHALADNCKASGTLESLRALLDAGANPSALGHAGWRPLHFVAKHGCIDFAKRLIDSGANPNERADSPEEETPLMIAARNGRSEFAKFLLAEGADTNLRDRNEWSAADHARHLMHRALAKDLESK